MSVVLPEPELPIRRMFGAGCPTRCLTTATEISRNASSCPTTPLRNSSKTSRGWRLNASIVVILSASRDQRMKADGAGIGKNLLVAGDKPAAAFDRLRNEQAIEPVAMEIRKRS